MAVVLKIKRINGRRAILQDTYVSLIQVKWRYLLALTFLAYIFINLIFGIVYYIFRDGLHPNTLGLMETFFFSVHTFSTVGYGNVFPDSTTVHALTVLETFVGLVSVALMTGLIFSKFSRPTARFLFSKVILITTQRGLPAIVFRVANERLNNVMDAEMSLTAAYDDRTSEGIYYRRFFDLKLMREKTPLFALSMTCTHIVEPGSFSDDLVNRLSKGENIEFLASVKGLDETLGHSIHSGHLYRAGSIHMGGQFKDVLSLTDDGTRILDFAKFHLVDR